MGYALRVNNIPPDAMPQDKMARRVVRLNSDNGTTTN
ncbi:hypothetical protein AAUPMB_01469 [Pasteurella multocida subsp. multocida str. Anand1_buffalo]|nr:hypothetical protein AAUPMB_01469 [Pasteurella multocida subsp. multocida str. Anand1_buffalo]